MSSTPGGVFVRRAEFDDAQSIQALVGEEAPLMAKRFGAFDITNMIENASLGISAVDEKGAVVEFDVLRPMLARAAGRQRGCVVCGRAAAGTEHALAPAAA